MAVKIDDLVTATHPREHRVFAGRLEMRRLGFVQRTIARAVHAGEGDFRDWDAIQEWATGIADALEDLDVRVAHGLSARETRARDRCPPGCKNAPPRVDD